MSTLVANRVGDWMQTYTGKAYWPLDPRVDDVEIEDIAHALSQTVRFGGHIKQPYSVAEHSVLVSQVVPREHALQGLLHDATEAYLGDMVRPLKRMIPLFSEIEATNWSVIARRFNVPFDLHPSVKQADNTVLLAERDSLLGPTPLPWAWADGLEPAPVSIACWPWAIAKAKFLLRYIELTQEISSWT